MKTKLTMIGVVAVFSIGLACAAELQTSNDIRRVPVPDGYMQPKGSIVIRNARLFDGTGANARPAVILIEGSHITKIAESDQDLALRDDVQEIDAGGKTVMPGLIDLHVHLTYLNEYALPGATSEDSQADAALRGAERLRYYLESGITSVRDVGAHGMAVFALKQYVYNGRIPGSRVFPAGQILVGTGGHSTEGFRFHTAPEYPGAQIHEVDGPDAWRAAVRLQFKRGADLIKLTSHYSLEEVEAAIDEAHKLGLPVTVDSHGIYTEMAVQAGVDCVEHPLPRTDETIRLMATKGICADITLVSYQYINDDGAYWFSTSRRFPLDNDTIMAMAQKLKDAGVTLGVGTDLTFGLFKTLPEPYIQELRNFLYLGYSPPEALVAATRTNSEIIGMSDRLGTVEVGKLADLIFVDGHPDVNIEELSKVDMVIMNGRVVVRDGRTFIPRQTEEKAPQVILGDLK